MGEKGGFVIRIGQTGVMASHLITINGIFNLEYWEKEEIENFIKTKMQEIDELFQAEIELLNIEMGRKTRIRMQVLVASVGSKRIIEEWSRKWLKNHIGPIARITKLEVRAVSPLARISNGG